MNLSLSVSMIYPMCFTRIRQFFLNPRNSYFIFSVLLMLQTQIAFSDEDMPTAEEMAEMQQMMESVQDQLENLDPDVKAQMDAMMKQVPAADDAMILPDRNSQLNKINDAALNSAALKKHLAMIQLKLETALSADALQRAKTVLAEVKKKTPYLPSLRASANGLAAMGALQEATYLTAVLANQTGDVQDLANLAAFLVMLHAEPAALPILHTLNNRYPNNSTLLNNLGQAYYQLGDINRASSYLAAAVQRTPLHPQANFTQGLIQQSKGDFTAARKSHEQALAGGYSETKEKALKDAGGKWQPKGAWRGPMPQDPLGLEQINLPDFPTDPVALPKAASSWDAFRTQVRQRMALLEKQRSENLSQFDSMSQSQMMRSAMGVLGLPFKQQAIQSMKAEDEQFQRDLKKFTTDLVIARTNHASARMELHAKLESLRAANEEKYASDPVGEDAHKCDGVSDAYTEYLQKVNPVLEPLERAYLETLRRHANEQAYLAQFVEPNQMAFNAVKIASQLQFTQALLDADVALDNIDPNSWQSCLDRPLRMTGKLAEYNDIHCDYVSELVMPGIGSMRFKCDKAEVELAPVMAPFELAWASKYTGKGDDTMLLRASAAISVDAVKVGGYSEFDENGFNRGGVNIGVSADLGSKLGAGPLEIGNSVSITGTLEFDRNGVSDIGVGAGIESKISSTLAETDQGGKLGSALSAGADSTWSWNSGFNSSVSGDFDSSVFNL